MAIDRIHITNDALTANKTLTLDMATSGDDKGIVIFNMEGLGPPMQQLTRSGGRIFPELK